MFKYRYVYYLSNKYQQYYVNELQLISMDGYDSAYNHQENNMYDVRLW